MRNAVAVLLVIAMLAAVWWFGYEQPRREARARELAAQGRAPGAAPATTTVYRWKDAQGVTQLSSTPPPSGPYETVTLRDDQNVVPMEGPAPEPPN